LSKIVIIGNGIAGSTAARFVRKYSDHEIVMISGETLYPYSRTALMYIYMGHMRFENTKLYEDWFWEKNRIQVKQAFVNNIDTQQKRIILDSGENISYDKLIIAAGSKPNKFGWPGQDLNGVQGLYHLQDLEKMETATTKGIKRAVIVGGGLIGIEMAEMFHSRGIQVTMLVREASFWDIVLPSNESEMINKHILTNGIDLRLNEELLEIKGKDGNVNSIICKNSGEELACDFVGLTVGVSPNIDFVKSSAIKTNRGIVVNEFLETSEKDVYAIGDCAELLQPQVGRRPIEAIWYTGKMMGETVASTISDQPKIYDPGIWYNSAKFFDVEYQVYGNIPTTLPENIATLYWQHPSQLKTIRINYEKITNTVTGFNLMGIRYRHAVCEKWIKDKYSIEEVLKNLSLANFDPEFFEEYETELVKLYNKNNSTQLNLQKKRKLSLVKSFLSMQ
jgi:NAD(P)H-nitrite reductase large subunit